MVEEVLGWPLVEARRRLEEAGWQVVATRPTLAPGAEAVGEPRVARIREFGNRELELTVVYVPTSPSLEEED
ncbi:hypothetical protein [Desulfothermobacter acidiphilus]|uniref:hypothetical protein n=1 Tax=Desulfothermobacter acidiphilus TaxID=1938353 RepID=UPI003F8930B9